MTLEEQCQAQVVARLLVSRVQLQCATKLLRRLTGIPLLEQLRALVVVSLFQGRVVFLSCQLTRQVHFPGGLLCLSELLEDLREHEAGLAVLGKEFRGPA